MKNILLIISLVLNSLFSFCQVASRVINTQAASQGHATNIMYLDISGGLVNNKILNCNLDSITLKQFTIANLPDSLKKKYDISQVDALLTNYLLSSVAANTYQIQGNYLIPSDSTSFRSYSNTLYQSKGNYLVPSDSVSFRSYSNILYQSALNTPNSILRYLNGFGKYVSMNTDSIAEGGSNFFYTSARFNASLSTKTTDNLAEGASNFYFTVARARASISSGTNISYNSTTGVITNGITNNNQISNGSGYITGISSSDVTTALGFTPYNSTNPNGYITSANIAGKLNISDSTGNTGYVQIWRLNKVRDSLQANINLKGTGTVTSIGLTSSDLSFTGSPITTSGNIGLTLNNSLKVLRFGNCAGAAALRVWDTIVVNPATSNNLSVSYASAGFSSTPIVSCVPLFATNNAYASPQASLYSATNSSASFNITVGNGSLVSILGFSVLSGASIQFPVSLSGYSLHVLAIGT